MVAWLAPVLSAGASLIGGVLNRRSAEKQQQVSYSENADIRREDRKWYVADRTNERNYAKTTTSRDRQYAEKQNREQRRYARDVLVDDRNYTRDKLKEDRQFDRRTLLDARDYSDKKLTSQRQYDEKMYARDVNRYTADRNAMQTRSNILAEKTASSRGIDFTKMRDDAVKAGYNPMTALSMAHAYSTQVDYALQGGVYSPGASYTTSNQPYMQAQGQQSAGGGGVSSGGGASPGAVMPSVAPAAGNFQAGGGGYNSQFNPALSAGSFVTDAMDRAIDTWSNQKVDRDPLADALRNAFAQDQMAEQVRDAQVPGGFGYSLTQQQPFQPSGRIGVPSLASGKAAVTAPRMPSGMMEVGGRKFVPVTKPNGKPGRLEASIAGRLDIKPFDTVSPGDWAEIVGEVGEVESLIDNPAIRRNITDEWHMGVPIGNSVRDYFKSGRTGNKQIPQSRMGQFPGAW